MLGGLAPPWATGGGGVAGPPGPLDPPLVISTIRLMFNIEINTSVLAYNASSYYINSQRNKTERTSENVRSFNILSND